MKLSIKSFTGIILSIAVMGLTACESVKYTEEFIEGDSNTEEIAAPVVADNVVADKTTTDSVIEGSDDSDAMADLEDRIAELEDELESARSESDTDPDTTAEPGVTTLDPAERPELGAYLSPDVINIRPYIKTTLNFPTASEDQDVDWLMKHTFRPDGFTKEEADVQTKLMTAHKEIQPASFRNALKQYVIVVVRELIRVQRAEGIGGVVPVRYWKDLGFIIAAYKTGVSSKAVEAVHSSKLPYLPLVNQTGAVTDAGVVKQAGAYLQLQFAEVYKDIVKASYQGGGEIHESSTMAVDGGSGLNNLGLVYWCCAATGGYRCRH